MTMRYKVKHKVWQVSESTWWLRDLSYVKEAILCSRHGYARLCRYVRRDRGLASVEFIAGGKDHRWTIRPCPTRLGLARMANRLIRELMEGEGDAADD